MKLYGIASAISGDVDEWSLTQAEAEQKLAEVIADEPHLAGALYVEAVELGTGSSRSPN